MDWLLTDRHHFLIISSQSFIKRINNNIDTVNHIIHLHAKSPLSRHALFTSEILSHDIQQIQLSHTNHQMTGSGIFYLASITVYSDTHLSHSTSHKRLPSIFTVYGQQQSTDVMRSEFRCIQEMLKYIPVCMQFGYWVPLMLWYCYLYDRKGIQPAKNLIQLSRERFFLRDPAYQEYRQKLTEKN